MVISQPYRRLRLLAAAAGVCSAALLFAVVLQHFHADSVSDDTEDSCRGCQISDVFSATPPAPPVLFSTELALISERILLPTYVPRGFLVIRLAFSRAPPARA